MDKRFAFSIREASGAVGDLGTLLPLLIGAIAVGGMPAQPVILGFALFYVMTAVVYRLPIPVQPMKAVAAVLLIGAVTPGSVAVAGVMIGAVLLLLGGTGLIDRLARLVPQSVLAGLQLGLGIALGLVALHLIAPAPLVGIAGLAALALLTLAGLPAALVFVIAATLVGLALPGQQAGLPVAGGFALPAWPGAQDLAVAAGHLALPQLSLTIGNAVLLTALVARDCFGDRAQTVTPRRLALTSGIANLVLTPFGAMPMCHGAGGVAAHARFGARTGGAPLMLGLALVLVAVVPGGLQLVAAVPLAALGALLMIAAADLAWNRRIFDCKPSCRPVIAATAAATVIGDPFVGLIVGTAAELARKAILTRLRTAGRP